MPDLVGNLEEEVFLGQVSYLCLTLDYWLEILGTGFLATKFISNSLPSHFAQITFFFSDSFLVHPL